MGLVPAAPDEAALSLKPAFAEFQRILAEACTEQVDKATGGLEAATAAPVREGFDNLLRATRAATDSLNDTTVDITRKKLKQA